MSRKNPTSPPITFTLRVEKTGYGDMVTASSGGKVFYGGDPERQRDLDELKKRVLSHHPNAVFVWGKTPRLDRETLADLAVDRRKSNPVRSSTGPGAILMFKGSGLVLAEDSDEENRLRAEGWDEAGDKVVRKLAKLRSLDKNGWAELTDSMFTEGDLDGAIDLVTRQNPAVQGDAGRYRLLYMEPGRRAGTVRRAIRKVDSVAEAERWMTANADRAFPPASVMTPGNRYQEPETVAILGSSGINAGAASMT